MQFQGTERWRQGWSEYQTTAGQVANRYLTCTADTGPGAPAGTTYGGTLALLPGDPGVAGPDNVWAEDPTGLPPGYPLYVRDTLSASCGSGRQYPWSTVPDTDGATLLSATQRTLSTPPGLRLTLSDPQTPASILADAQSVRDAAWPPDPPAVPPPGYVAPVIPALSFQGAINFTSADGDHVVAQKMRFKLHYSANDTRVLTTSVFSVLHQWAYRHTDLLTGAVTLEPRSLTIEYPIEVQTTDPTSGVVTTTYVYYTDDIDWTEVTAGENESVELVMLPGTNANPTTFGGVTVTVAPR